MKPLRTVSAPAIAIDMPNVDTDQIIPARFLRKPRRPGYHLYLFHDIRRAKDGSMDPAFPLNQESAKGAEILVADRAFACGSSREGAVYALVDQGFRVVIAPSFGDIFASNSVKNGLLALVLPEATVRSLLDQLKARPGATISLDLEAKTLTGPDGKTIPFDVDAYVRETLLAGRDDITLTLEHAAAIDASLSRMASETPWLMPTKA
ncbi:MAG: 3-isopropylmalate dehydratase small subunit [Hyphomicrobiaceae bacterium]